MRLIHRMYHGFRLTKRNNYTCNWINVDHYCRKHCFMRAEIGSSLKPNQRNITKFSLSKPVKCYVCTCILWCTVEVWAIVREMFLREDILKVWDTSNFLRVPIAKSRTLKIVKFQTLFKLVSCRIRKSLKFVAHNQLNHLIEVKTVGIWVCWLLC
jgi:hypothetical protein